MRDYRRYYFSKKEYVLFAIQALGIVSLVMYIPTSVYRLHGVLESVSRKVRTTFTETEPMQI